MISRSADLPHAYDAWFTVLDADETVLAALFLHLGPTNGAKATLLLAEVQPGRLACWHLTVRTNAKSWTFEASRTGN